MIMMVIKNTKNELTQQYLNCVYRLLCKVKSPRRRERCYIAISISQHSVALSSESHRKLKLGLVWGIDDRSGTTAAGRKSSWSDQATRERTLWQYMTIVTINSNLLPLSLSLCYRDIRAYTYDKYRVIWRNHKDPFGLIFLGRHLVK
jgi:hypothetical protein